MEEQKSGAGTCSNSCLASIKRYFCIMSVASGSMTAALLPSLHVCSWKVEEKKDGGWTEDISRRGIFKAVSKF